MNLKEALKDKLNKNQLSQLVKSFDLIGDIAIIEIPKDLIKKQRLIAAELLNLNKNIKAVFKKGIHKGIFRTQKLTWLSGQREKITECRENGIRLRLDVEKTYFSPRLATERKRIAEEVKKNESILVMFSGVGPYPIVISKNSNPRDIYSIEINPVAIGFQKENILINKIKNIKLFEGDVRKIGPKLNKKFDRILMPLPKGDENFLDISLGLIKKKGVVHFYDFVEEKDFPDKSIEKIKKECGKLNKKFKILKTAKCGQLAPRAYRVCIDFRVF